MIQSYSVIGMSCGHCVRAVEQTVGALPGVRTASVALASGLLSVEGDAIADAAIEAAVVDAGFALAR